LPQLGGQNANQNPQGGDAIDDQIPHICPTPPLGVNIDRCIICCAVYTTLWARLQSWALFAEITGAESLGEIGAGA
jgi:hypothetical protein